MAAVLYRLRQTQRTNYDLIVGYVRQVVSRFDDFRLEPDPHNPEYIMLNWREVDSDVDFGPHQLSDGSLRAIALFTLLMLPDNEAPALIVIDEPELGLHPAAISLLADLLRQASGRSQILLATQSMPLTEEFGIDDAVLCDRENGSSDISRRSPADVDGWTDTYSLGQVWASRAIGAWPKQGELK